MNKYENISGIETDIANTTLQFKAPKSMDIEATMNAVAEVTDKAKDWELIEN